MSYSLGYMKPFPGLRFGSSNRAYGTPGMGGSFGFADPDEQVGFAYAPNRSGFYLWDDPREKALRAAFSRCVARRAAAPGIRAQPAEPSAAADGSREPGSP
jgi:CubicO group peptidase (beta-lactamase class C family)